MQRTRVLMLFHPNTDTDGAEKSPPFCLCITVYSKKQEERRKEYDPVFVVHAAAALVTSAFRATLPCLLLLAAAFLHHCD